jgi:hypothetical protein
MSDARRWSDPNSDATDSMREVMRHAQRQGPSAAQVEALTAKVLAQLPQAPVAPGAATGISLGAKLGALGLLVAGSAWWWAATREATPPPQGRTVQEQTAQLPAVTPEAVNAEPPKTAAVETSPPAEAAAPTQPSRRKQVERGVAANELQLLHTARTVRHEQPERALSLLRQHERAFPRSALAEERDALLIELLRTLDPVESAARLKAFERQHPQSPYDEALHNGE